MIEGSKNKGDWGEFYALLYLLAKGKIYSADEHLNEISSYYFPIIRIMRDEKHKKTNITNHMDYVISTQNGIDTIDIYMDSRLMQTKTAQEFQDEVDKLSVDIPLGRGRQFTIPHGENFLNSIYLKRLAAPSTEVTDIKVEVRDTNTARNQEMGFSIKSYLGGAPTLLNASGATNFVYEVIGLTQTQKDQVNAINTRSKIIDRIAQIETFGGSLEFRHAENSTFSSNLMMVDSCMEKIISEMLLYYYQTNTKDCNAIVQFMETSNPLRYPREGMYEYKFKKFLCAKALGMDPSKEWGGMDEANGGYIAVKSDGNVLAYFLYDRNKFEKYLLDNTHFERASTRKFGFASIYDEGGRMYMKLNLDIRFYDNH